MKKPFLPLWRRRRIWCAALAAILLFLLSDALLSRAVTRTAEQIGEAYDQMDIRFRLAPGRTRTRSDFTLSLFQLRELVKADWHTDFDATARTTGTVHEPVDRYMAPNEDGFWTILREPQMFQVTVLWTADPEKEFGPPSEGSYEDSGLYCSPAFAEKAGVQAGHLGLMFYNRNGWDYTNVTALSPGIPDNTVVLSWESFDIYVRDLPTYKSGITFSSLTFRIKPERNRDIREIADKIQKTVNTPSIYDRNKFVAVYYNETEINGTMDPLERRQASAVFFEKLFRMLLPVALHVLELVAALGRANEAGVRRLLGEGTGAVFARLWLPIAAVLSGGYLLSGALLWAVGLGANTDWLSAALHLAVSLAVTALTTALLCLLNPLTLLKERNDE